MTHIGFICLKNTNPQISNCSIILLKMENLVNREKWGQYLLVQKDREEVSPKLFIPHNSEMVSSSSLWRWWSSSMTLITT